MSTETGPMNFKATGTGGHMLPDSAKLWKKIGKDIGDDVVVAVSERLVPGHPVS